MLELIAKNVNIARIERLKYFGEILTNAISDFNDVKKEVEIIKTSNENIAKISSENVKEFSQIKEESKNNIKNTWTIMALFVSMIAIIVSNMQIFNQPIQVSNIILMNLSLLFAINFIFALISNLSEKEFSLKKNFFYIFFSLILILMIVLVLLLFK